MTPVEAAATIRDAMKNDPDLSSAVRAMVHRTACKDVYEWVNEHPDMAVAMAEQLGDINGQIANMDTRIKRGELT